jgi:hypothetical protein
MYKQSQFKNMRRPIRNQNLAQVSLYFSAQNKIITDLIIIFISLKLSYNPIRQWN